MKTILTIGNLREAIAHLKNEDIVVVEIHEGERREDLYPFYIDEYTLVADDLNGAIKEVHFCI